MEETTRSEMDTDLDEPLPVLQLTHWPLRHAPRYALGSFVVVLATSLAIGWASGSQWLGRMALALLLLALWRIWIPVRFELDARGLQHIVFRRRRFVPWSAVARYEVDPRGVLLLNRSQAYPFTALRGLYVAASGDQHAELVRLVTSIPPVIDNEFWIEMNSRFQHQRHKRLSPLEHPRELVLAVPPMQSNVNLSRIVRAAGCFGIPRIVAGGGGTVDRKISRDAADHVTIEVHRSLIPVLKKMRSQGYRLAGLEQATHSQVLYNYRFARKTLLLVGHERHGISEAELSLLDDVVEIPVHGLPYSHNAATSAVIAIYEYCRQYPSG